MAKAYPPKAWGSLLAKLRHDIQLSGAEVVRRLEKLGIETDRASVYAYEAGRVSAPDAGLVWGLAHVYGVGTDELISALVAARSGQSMKPLQSNNRMQAAGFDLAKDEREIIMQFRKLPPRERRLCREFVFAQRRPLEKTNRVG